MEAHEPLNDQPQKRPVLLTVIGILTFINLGFAALILMATLASGPRPDSEIESLMEPSLEQAGLMHEQGMHWFGDQIEKVVQVTYHRNHAFGLTQLLEAGVVFLGIAGVVLMFRRKRLGFHFYIISCLLRITSFYLISPVADVPSLYVGYYFFTSFLFILLYSRTLSWANQ